MIPASQGISVLLVWRCFLNPRSGISSLDSQILVKGSVTSFLNPTWKFSAHCLQIPPRAPGGTTFGLGGIATTARPRVPGPSRSHWGFRCCPLLSARSPIPPPLHGHHHGLPHSRHFRGRCPLPQS